MLFKGYHVIQVLRMKHLWQTILVLLMYQAIAVLLNGTIMDITGHGMKLKICLQNATVMH